MLQQLLTQVRSYLDSALALEDLETWLIQNLQAIIDSGDRVALWVANQIDADLVEFGEGLFGEDILRRRLQVFCETATRMSSFTAPVGHFKGESSHSMLPGTLEIYGFKPCGQVYPLRVS